MRVLQASSTPRLNQDQSTSSQKSILRRKKLQTFESIERKRRRKPGTVAVKQIKYYQKTTDLLLRNLPFERLVKEIAGTLAIDDIHTYRWKLTAVKALQWAVEAYMIALLEDTNKAAIHAKRVTIRPEDMHLVRDIRGSVNVYEKF